MGPNANIKSNQTSTKHALTRPIPDRESTSCRTRLHLYMELHQALTNKLYVYTPKQNVVM